VDFGRLITAMVTPFDEQLQVDYKQFARIIDYLITEQRNDALVVTGTTGESPTLTDEEKVRLFELAAKHADGRCKIIAGTGSNDTAHSIHLTREAEKAGADGILLVAPYYNRPSQEGLYQHFKAIAESTRLPVMLYNIPSRTGIQLSVDLTVRLSEVPNIVATKEAHNDFDHISQILAKARPGFQVYSGDDSLTLPMMSLGARGVVSVASHVRGARMKDMIDAFVNGDVRTAASIHAELFPVFHGLFNCPHRVPNPAPVKHALKLLGYDAGGLRLPLVPVNEEEGRFIAALLK